MKKKNLINSFCIVPWTHTFITPQSERRLCSASRIDLDLPDLTSKDYIPETLEEFWNGEYIRSIRVKMLNGEIPKGCMSCHKNITTAKPLRDYFNRKMFPHIIDKAIESTTSDGQTSLKPRSFDYRVSNKCNFSCRMCGDKLSSRWEKENLENGLWSHSEKSWLHETNREKIRNFQNNVVAAELEMASKGNDIEEIYWAGGEPLLWDLHWKCMQNLINSNQSQNMTIRYSTNLSVIRFGKQNLFENILQHFKFVNLFISIDGTGNIGEYIRTGLVYKNWKKNLLKAKSFASQNSNTHIKLDLTLTLPGIFSLKSLIDLANETQIPILPKIVYSFEPSTVISPLALPRNILKNLLKDIIKYNLLHLSIYTKDLFELLLDLKNFETYDEKFPNSFKKEFHLGREKLLRIEEIRKDSFTLSDIYKENKEVYDWWTKT